MVEKGNGFSGRYGGSLLMTGFLSSIHHVLLFPDTVVRGGAEDLWLVNIYLLQVIMRATSHG